MFFTRILLPQLSILPLSIFHHFFPILRLFVIPHFFVVNIHPKRTIRGKNNNFLNRFVRYNIPHAPDLYPINIEIPEPVSIQLGQLLNFFVIFEPIKVFPCHVLESFCEAWGYTEHPTDYFTCFYLFRWLVHVFLSLTVRHLQKDLVPFFKDIHFSRVLVSTTTKHQPSNLEILTVGRIFRVSLEKVHIHRIDVLCHSTVEAHVNIRIVIAPAYILICFNVECTDWRMMRYLLKT